VIDLIYTVGHTESYELGFEQFKDNPEDFKKMGKREDYSGDSVFMHREQAELFLVESGITDFAAYGLLADWDKETEPNDHGQFNNLMIDAQLVKLDIEGR
jgi:hypothetical protein